MCPDKKKVGMLHVGIRDIPGTASIVNSPQHVFDKIALHEVVQESRWNSSDEIQYMLIECS